MDNVDLLGRGWLARLLGSWNLSSVYLSGVDVRLQIPNNGYDRLILCLFGEVYETKATPRPIEARDFGLIENRSGLNQGGEGQEEMQFEKKVASVSSREDP
jgi:hypothetical protein